MPLVSELKDRLRRNWRAGLKGAALSVAAGWLCLFVQGLGNLSYDLNFFLRPNLEVDEAVIVYMDEPSHRFLNEPFDTPWDRKRHAQLLDKLTAYGARVVAFDVMFEDAKTNTPAQIEVDRRLIDAVRKHGQVALAGMAQAVYKDVAVWRQVTEPFPELKTNAAGWGLVERTSESASAIRIHLSDRDNPSLAWVAASLSMTNPPPFRAERLRFINFYGPPLYLPHYSFYQVLDEKTDLAEAFSNKVVFVGAHPSIPFTGGWADLWRTPYSRWTGEVSPGVEINATTFLNLRRGDWLTLMPPWMELILEALVGVLAGLGLALLSPKMGWRVALGLSLAMAAAAFALFVLAHVWFSWLIPCIVQIPAVLGWMLVSKASPWRTAFAQPVPGAVPTGPEGTVLVASPGAPARAAHIPSSLMQLGAMSEPPNFFTPGGIGGGQGAGAPAYAQIPDHAMLRCIGRGAYGEVWLARDVIGSYHAVKIVYRRHFENDVPYEREFKGLKKFTPISRMHPGLVQILHVGRNDKEGYIYYVMEAGDDEKTGQKIDPENYTARNLSRDLKERGRYGSPESVTLAIQLASALAFLHQQQLIHRDIKPSNIIFVNGQPKFADIGLVTDISTRTGDISYVGTLGYMPPEGPGTPAGDVFSLGKVLYEVCTGMSCTQFPELPATFVEGALDRKLFALNRIITKACEPERANRYPSAAEVHEDLLKLKD